MAVYLLGGGEPLGEQCVADLIEIGEVECSRGRERYRHVGIRRHVCKALLGEEPGQLPAVSGIIPRWDSRPMKPATTLLALSWSGRWASMDAADCKPGSKSSISSQPPGRRAPAM